MEEQQKTRRIKIICTGSGDSILPHTRARVIDVETGESIPWVSRVEIIIDAKEGIHAILHVWGPDIEVEEVAEIVEHNPMSRYVMSGTKGDRYVSTILPVGGLPK